ncbi:MAG: bifunctional nuclease family protein [Candidatus Margulisiibacteriota bacterium]|jgi:bifunctional DNase/RNase
MIEMQLGGLGFDPKNMSPIVLLRDPEERNFLPIWIGMFEAAAIAMELQDFKPPRPMTHDIITTVIARLGAHVTRIVISEIVDNTFYAVIEVQPKSPKEELLKIDSRPSDAIAVAVRTKVPIFVSEQVMVKAKMVNTEKDDEEAKKFSDFIERINPDDFSKYFDKR